MKKVESWIVEKKVEDKLKTRQKSEKKEKSDKSVEWFIYKITICLLNNLIHLIYYSNVYNKMCHLHAYILYAESIFSWFETEFFKSF